MENGGMFLVPVPPPHTHTHTHMVRACPCGDGSKVDLAPTHSELNGSRQAAYDAMTGDGIGGGYVPTFRTQAEYYDQLRDGWR